MTADIINLRRARKEKMRSGREREAAAVKRAKDELVKHQIARAKAALNAGPSNLVVLGVACDVPDSVRRAASATASTA